MDVKGLVAAALAIVIYAVMDRYRPLTHKRQLTIVLVAAAVYVALLLLFLTQWGDRYVS